MIVGLPLSRGQDTAGRAAVRGCCLRAVLAVRAPPPAEVTGPCTSSAPASENGRPRRRRGLPARAGTPPAGRPGQEEAGAFRHRPDRPAAPLRHLTRYPRSRWLRSDPLPVVEERAQRASRNHPRGHRRGLPAHPSTTKVVNNGCCSARHVSFLTTSEDASIERSCSLYARTQRHTCARVTQFREKNASQQHTCAAWAAGGGNGGFETLTAFAPQPPTGVRSSHRWAFAPRPRTSG